MITEAQRVNRNTDGIKMERGKDRREICFSRFFYFNKKKNKKNHFKIDLLFKGIKLRKEDGAIKQNTVENRS